MAGATLRVASEETAGDIKNEISKELEEARIVTDDNGVMVKADTLGSLEAIVNELREAKIPIARAEVGDISKRDLVNAQTVNDPLYRVILGFNVATLPEAKDYLQTTDIKAFNSDVI
jgi:translation initiation factor 5B